MRKTLLAAMCGTLVALAVPALGAAAIIATDVTKGNDLGSRSAVVTYSTPTNADEGALVGPTICLPPTGSTFNVGVTAVACSSFVDGGEICPLPGICFPLPDVAVSGGFNVTVNIVRCTILGTAGPETLSGTALKDWICGRGDRDLLNGLAGNDILVGAGGADTLVGGGGRDGLSGGNGNDTLKARDGLADKVNCGLGGNDLAIVDSHDRVRANCERVRRR
jgi:hypothetical protein